MPARGRRQLHTAELLSIGSELTVGETRDTNAAELARSLTDEGVSVRRITALPDDLAAVSDAFERALRSVDLVVSTGGLGPTPDDLTREAIAAACGETPTVDPALEAWLRQIWARRGMPFPEMNLKQAWLIPSATAIPNDGGTAPGWWVERDGRIVVALPGPPREMRPLWRDWVLPRLRERGLGREVASLTYRLTGIGESAVADILGEAFLRRTNPVVATYARSDGVDVRVSAVAQDGSPATELVAEAARTVRDKLERHVWATGETTWPEAVGTRLAELGLTLAIHETGSGGALVALLGELPMLVAAEVAPPGRGLTAAVQTEEAAQTVRERSGADVGLALRVRPRGEDTAVTVAFVTGAGMHRERRLVLFGGALGHGRAALAAAAILLERLRADDFAATAGREEGRALGRSEAARVP
jgi:nicotinamide-nucleotide amidase